MVHIYFLIVWNKITRSFFCDIQIFFMHPYGVIQVSYDLNLILSHLRPFVGSCFGPSELKDVAWSSVIQLLSVIDGELADDTGALIMNKDNDNTISEFI